jgi:hypothetical protein
LAALVFAGNGAAQGERIWRASQKGEAMTNNDGWVDYYGDPVDPNGYGIDPMSGDTIGSLGSDPTIQDQYGVDNLGTNAYGDTVVNTGGPDYFPDPGAQSGGSVTSSNGGTAQTGGGSGFGTFLSGLGTFAGQFLRGAGIVNGSPTGTPQGRTAAGAPCVLGTLGCSVPAPAQNSTMLVLVAVGAIVLIVALRGK